MLTVDPIGNCTLQTSDVSYTCLKLGKLGVLLLLQAALINTHNQDKKL